MRANGQQTGTQAHPERPALAPLRVAHRPVKFEQSEYVWYYGNDGFMNFLPETSTSGPLGCVRDRSPNA